jgi:queuosine precursor transporter
MKYRFLVTIGALYAASLLIADTLSAAKVFVLFGFSIPAGTIVFPLSFLADDLLTEVYGYSASRRVIWSGLAALLLMISCYEIARVLPPASFWQNQAAFETIFSHVPRVVLASSTAYLCGEFVNSYILAKMKVWMGGSRMWLRFVASTTFGELVDTLVFVSIAFTGVFPFDALVNIFLSVWIFKVVWEVIALPISLPLARWLKRVEHEDYYDRDTDFNPFQAGQRVRLVQHTAARSGAFRKRLCRSLCHRRAFRTA